MKKKLALKAILFLFLAGTMLASIKSSCIGGEVYAAPVGFTATELLGRPTNVSITVTVVPSGNGQIYFQYGTTSGVYPQSTSTTALVAGTPKTILITGLTPNTKYYYRMASSDNGVDWGYGSEHSFRTQRSQGSTFTFDITSDSHVNILLGSATQWNTTIMNVVNDHPDFLIDCGDTFSMDYSSSGSQVLVTTQAEADQRYLYQRQFFDEIGNSASIFIAPGNHEQQEAWHLDDTGNPATSLPVFAVNAQKKYYPNPVPNAFYSGNSDPYSSIDGDHLREDYYAWTWGDALFVVIDPYWYTTTKPFAGNTGGGESSETGSGNRWDWTLGSQQFNWFKQVLQGSNAAYKFVFTHHMTGGSDDYGGRGGAVPANLFEWGGYNGDGTTYTWGTNRPVAQWGSTPVHQMMVANNVSAFFHGHDHQYGYEVRDGIVYQSLASAGFSGNGFGSYTEGGYTLRALPSPGHLRVTVTPAQTTVEYVSSATATNNQVVHSYTILPYNLVPEIPGAGVLTVLLSILTVAIAAKIALSKTGKNQKLAKAQ
jgi:hypothetical protein